MLPSLEKWAKVSFVFVASAAIALIAYLLFNDTTSLNPEFKAFIIITAYTLPAFFIIGGAAKLFQYFFKLRNLNIKTMAVMTNSLQQNSQMENDILLNFVTKSCMSYEIHDLDNEVIESLRSLKRRNLIAGFDTVNVQIGGYQMASKPKVIVRGRKEVVDYLSGMLQLDS